MWNDINFLVIRQKNQYMRIMLQQIVNNNKKKNILRQLELKKNIFMNRWNQCSIKEYGNKNIILKHHTE